MKVLPPRKAPRSSAQRRNLGLLLLAGAILFALAGQYYFAERRNFLNDGVTLYAIGMILFAAAARLLDAPADEAQQRQSWWHTLAAHPLRTGLTIAGLLSALVAARITVAEPQPSDFTSAVIAWLLAAALVIGAQLPPPAAWRQRLASVSPWARAHAFELAALAFWLILAAFLRTWQLEQIPYPLSGDEAAMGLEARRVLANDLHNPFATGWLSHPTMWFFWMADLMKLFGTGMIGLRILSALVGTSTVLTLYLLAREVFGIIPAQLAVALLVTTPVHLHFSRQGLNNITDAWLSPLAFFFLYRGLRRNDTLSMALAGVTLGLLQYGYLGGRVVPVIMAAYFVYLILVEGDFLQKHFGHLVVMAVAALAVAMPILLW